MTEAEMQIEILELRKTILEKDMQLQLKRQLRQIDDQIFKLQPPPPIEP